MNLNVLEPKLPHMKCDAGCGKCCGPVICKADEHQRIRDYCAANGIVAVRQGMTCPYFQNGTCAVHPVRPFICRLFGHSPKLVCAKGYNVCIPEKRERKLMDAYMRSGRADVWLHTDVYSDDELLLVLAGGGA